jgi:hypothetical protein
MNEFIEKVIKTLVYYKNKILIWLRSLRYQIFEAKLYKPIFVVGCSRAGTTLVYKTLSESKYLGTLQKETHDFWARLHPAQERNWESHEIPEKMACDGDKKYVSRFFYTQTGKKRIVDKNNQNGLSIPYLLKLFPDAHFIYIKRNPGDNINSLIQGWNKADEFATWSDDLPEKVNIENDKNQRWCFFLAKGWRNYTKAKIEEVCAFQYIAMNEAILNAKKNIPAKQWHEISYETLINEPLQEFEQIFLDCGVIFDNHLKQHCKEVLQKPYNTFSEIRIDKWKDGQNKEKIEKILPEVNNIAKRMGY